jgi:hypothetical protein
VRAGLAALAFVLSFGAAGQDCKLIADSALRLNCWDMKAGYVPPAIAPDEPAKPTTFSQDFHVANEITAKGGGSDPASISLSRKDGESFSTIKAALIWEPAVATRVGTDPGSGWGPSVALSINKQTLKSKPIDIRSASFGMYGTPFTSKEYGISLLTKASYTYREDGTSPARSDLLMIDNVIVADALLNGIPNKSPFSWFIYPRFGAVYEDVSRAKTGDPTGSRDSVYMGIRAEAYPRLLSDRIRLLGLGQRFVDTTVNGGLGKQRATYWKFDFDYALSAPGDTSGVVPSIGFERTTGADPLNGIPRAGITQLMLRLKIN